MQHLLPDNRYYRFFNIACFVAEAEQLSAESGDFQDEAGSGQFEPRGDVSVKLRPACNVSSASLLSVLQHR